METDLFCRLWQASQHLRKKVHSRLSEKERVPAEVKAALQECKDMYQLLDFLFNTDFYKDEAVLSLFEQRIQELDASLSTTSILHH